MKKSAIQMLLVLVAMALLVVVGCEKKGPMESAGEKVDNAAEATGDAIEDAGDAVDDAINR